MKEYTDIRVVMPEGAITILLIIMLFVLAGMVIGFYHGHKAAMKKREDQLFNDEP